MIVKDEERVIERCLTSARPLIDSWVIVDTGSTDGTRERVLKAMQGVPGRLLERPWVDFAHNRNEALAEARRWADYTLIIDADEEFEAAPGFTMPPLTEPGYMLEIRDNAVSYRRIQLVRNDRPWRYKGALHEYMAGEEPGPPAFLPGLRIRTYYQGARSFDPATVERDASVLEEALRREPDNARHHFYLAQTYFFCGKFEAALDHYRRRLTLGGWPEEDWFALYQVAEVLRRMEAPMGEVEAAYEKAFAARPWRAEPLYRLAAMRRWRGEHEEAYALLGRAMGIAYPKDDVLFVERKLYEYLIPLAYASCCYRTGRHAEAVSICDARLSSGAPLSDSAARQFRDIHQASADKDKRAA